MSSGTLDPPSYEAVVNVIRTWPEAKRLHLVQDVLATLATERASLRKREPTLHRALGLLAPARPAPSDAEIAAFLESRRQERFGG